MTILVSDLIDSTKQHLLGSYRADYNFLTDTIDTSATTLSLDLSPLTGIGRGAVLAVGTELVLVKSVASQVCTVSRGWLGTDAASHTAGDVVEINPRFPRQQILDALQAEIASWGSDVFYEGTITLSGVSTTRGYDLTSLGDFYNVSQAVREPYTLTDGSVWPDVDFRIRRNMPTASFPSGSAIFFTGNFASAVDVQLTVQKPFVTSTFTEATDVITTCKLSNNLLDIPPYGAAWRLLSTREIKRTFNDAQPEARLAQDVPPGYTDQTAARLKKIRDDRLDAEAARLRSKTPLRF